MHKLSNQIKVANIIEDGRLAGPQNRMMKVASVLNNIAHTKIILPKRNSQDFQNQCNKLGIKYIPVSLSTMSSNWISIIRYIALFPYEILLLFHVLKKNKFDLVHLSGGCWQFKGLIAAKLAKIKVIWHLNDTNAPLLIRKFFSLLSPLANSIIFASERTRDYYKNYLPVKIRSFLIQSPVDVNFFDPSLKYNTEEFEKKNFCEDKIKIGTIGNINPNKGHITLLKTAKLLSNYSGQIIFFIIGPVYKSQRKYFESLKKIKKKEKIDNVIFLEGKKDIRPILKILDIYICSSDFEASPLSVWEAMAMEKAIVSSDVGDVRKFIENGVNGFLVEKGDAVGFADNIKKLIEKPNTRINFGKIAREVAKNKLDLNLCVKLHNLAYQKTISENRD